MAILLAGAWEGLSLYGCESNPISEDMQETLKYREEEEEDDDEDSS